MIKILTVILLVLFSTTHLAGIEDSNTVIEGGGIEQVLLKMSKEEINNVMALFDTPLKKTGTYKLKSNSSIFVPQSFSLALGEEINTVNKLIKGDPNNSNLEAVIFDETYENVILFENVQEGYVPLDVWDKIDPKLVLEAIIRNTENENIERKKNGIQESHILDWTTEPLLVKQTNIIYLGFETKTEDGRNLINVISIKLGRYGFEKITLIFEKDSCISFEECLEIFHKSYSFNLGSQYSDYKIGDKISSYGIDTLISSKVSGKVPMSNRMAKIFKDLRIASATPAGFLPKETIILKLPEKDKKNWKKISRNIDNREGLIEFVPCNQSIENFSEILAIHYSISYSNVNNTEEPINNLRDSTLAKHPENAVVWRLIEKNKTDFLYEVIHKQYKNNPPRHQIARAFLTDSGIHSIAFTEKKSEMNPTKRTLWIKLLKESAFVIPYQNAASGGLSLFEKA